MKNNKTYAVHLPDYRNANPYQSLLASALSKEHVETTFIPFSRSLLPLTRSIKGLKNIDVVHVHWIIDILQPLMWTKSNLVFYIKFSLLIIDVFLVRLRGKKVVWTVHNKLAHQQLNTKRELLVRKWFAKSVNRVIFHSNEAQELVSNMLNIDIRSKSKIIFHGNYIGSYPEPSNSKMNMRDHYGLPNSGTLISYVGVLRPYKGIETLIEAFTKVEGDNTRLLISGNPNSIQYKAQLAQLTLANSRISTDFQFLPEQKMIDYLAISDIICLPFSDTLTSGSTILAMSYAKPLILPESAKVFGCVPTNGAFYFGEEESLANVLNKVSKLTDLKLQKMGEANFLQAKKMSWETVGKLTTVAYQ
ncbi:glycosyltransferase [Paraglaciecola chathamensis]|uniref:Glycosyl transferase, group 1 n=1 Tax=Paraglaciecola chathamensis S18K6 TaxID=1127672 RepID=A0AAV3V1A6_9ALTE|nr:glycosyltransferase [Paraglaciecola chathamensis]GAC10807.1 glycosyl transferase, group 1 [Paraglaciecola chathamensis S18K6]